jgi:hypothetical protein
LYPQAVDHFQLCIKVLKTISKEFSMEVVEVRKLMAKCECKANNFNKALD